MFFPTMAVTWRELLANVKPMHAAAVKAARTVCRKVFEPKWAVMLATRVKRLLRERPGQPNL